MKSPITTHVLDTSLGVPASGMAVKLEQESAPGEWRLLSEKMTNAEGRILDLVMTPMPAGSYRLTFATEEYFSKTGRPSFYPEVTIQVRLASATDHYHIPLLVSGFGYSTYRGT